jgi:hypothetical protein
MVCHLRNIIVGVVIEHGRVQVVSNFALIDYYALAVSTLEPKGK